MNITNAGLIKFGEYSSSPYDVFDLPFFALLGVIGGLLGSFFNFINSNLNMIRRFYLNAKWKKVVETCVLSLVTALLIFYAPLITSSDCTTPSDKDLRADEIEYNCERGK